MDQEYILNIVKGGGAEEERKAFFRQVAVDQQLAKEYARLKNEFIIRSLPHRPNMVMLFNEQKPKNSIIHTLVKIAAILFIPLLAYFAYDMIRSHNQPGTETKDTALYRAGTGVRYTVNTGIKASLLLPDNTKVWLNSGSYLDIPGYFSNNHREIFLMGEAYFEVKSDPSSPFWVNTIKDIVVKVTGTEFNLSCYENDDNMKLTLFSGSLELIKDNKEVINVQPEEQVIIAYNTLKNDLVVVKDVEYVSAWKKGYLRFKNTPMDEVFRKLERWYGVRISVEDTTILKYSFTADFESESLLQVLELMKITTGINYQINSNNVRLYTSLL